MLICHLLIISSFLAYTKSQNEGDSCTKSDGSPGVCTPINNCPFAENDFKRHIQPVNCGYDNFEPVLCCGESVTVTTPKGRRVRVRKTTTTERPKEVNLTSECEKAERRGQKAYDKCIEYQEKYVYPCRAGPTTGRIRVNECSRKPEQLVTGGEDAYEGEFPHMALLGYGDGELSWMCGGVIVSERYVLTAGHCTVSRSNGKVKKIRVGILMRSDTVDPSKEYNVFAIKHPDYKPPIKYHDIALLKTDRDIELNKYVVPACLHDGGALFNNSAIVSGWGTTVFRHTDQADVLQKATVESFDDKVCERKFKNIRLMMQGYNSTTQLCYGDRVTDKDTCEGDSGGPLQVNHPTVRCMYWVIGITSWGKWCGIAGEPGLYTRVAHYVPWIESEVWP